VKLRVERDVLADGVAWAARALPSRPSLPVLSGLMLDASNGVLTISSFDQDVSARVDIDADVATKGRTLVSGRLLADITRSLQAKPVELDVVGSHVAITCGRSSFNLPTLPVEDYPRIPDMPTLQAQSPAHFSHTRLRRSLLLLDATTPCQPSREFALRWKANT